MNCPTCSKEMQRGFAEIHGTPMGFMFFGLSYKHLFFSAVGSDEEQVIVDNDDKVLTHYCRYCRTTVMRTKKQD